MFKLTSKLALSNLKQNRKLYYPFAIAVILTTMILYSFIALATTPHLETSYGGRTARAVLGFGCFRRPAGRRHFSGLCQWLCYEKSFQRIGIIQCFGDGEEASPRHDLMGIAYLLYPHSWSRTGLGALV